MQPREIEINTGHMVFSAQEWGDPDGAPVLALHGWLDNAASFAPLAPMLDGVRLISIDQAGHGRSQHRPAEMDYTLWNYTEDAIDIADTLELEEFSLLGHSLGAAVSTLTASVLGDRVKKMVLLDGLFPWPRNAEESPGTLAEYIKQRKAFRKGKPVNRYRSLEHAVRIRCMGQFPVSRESSRLLVERALYQDGDAWVWRTDPRLALPSPTRYTPEQALSFIENVVCEAHMIHARNGVVEQMIDSHRDRLSKVSLHSLDGSHHLHMDGQPHAVADIVNSVLAT